GKIKASSQASACWWTARKARSISELQPSLSFKCRSRPSRPINCLRTWLISPLRSRGANRMAFASNADFLTALDKAGELIRLSTPIATELETSAEADLEMENLR